MAAQSSARLDSLGNELKTLTGSSESEFLALGEKLQDFHARTAEISRLSFSIGELLSSTEVTGAKEIFNTIFVRMKQSKTRSEASAQILGDVLTNLSDMLVQLEGFRKILMFLRVLCMSTRVETARIQGEEGLGILAEDVSKMIGDIELKHRQLLEGTETLLDITCQTLGRIKSIETERRARAERVYENTFACIGELNQHQARSSALASESAAHYRRIAGSIGEIVASMQFHDITRQRVEHIAAALLSLPGSSDSDEQPGGQSRLKKACREWMERATGKAGSNRLGIIAELCVLQSAQLRLAADELVSAVESIIQNLGDIASNISGIARQTRSIAVGSGGKNTYMLEIERGISDVLADLGEYGDSEREVAVAMDTAGGTLGDLCQFADSIQAIGSKMRMIALNAIVKAAQMKEEGGPLGVLAESIHQLSIDSTGHVQSLTRSLDNIKTASAILSSRTGFSGTLAETESISIALNHSLDALRNADKESVLLLGKLDEEALRLADEIAGTASELNVHYRLSEPMNSIACQLGETAVRVAKMGIAETAVSESYLKGLKSSYTMESERLVHESLLRRNRAASAVTPAVESDRPKAVCTLNEETSTMRNEAWGADERRSPSLPETGSTAEVESELGDNVELF